MPRRPSAPERQLEALLTLSRADIDSARAEVGACLRLVEFCVDEEIELRESADEAHHRGDADLARHCEQEASAWRHTARVLRAMAHTAVDATQAPSRLA